MTMTDIGRTYAAGQVGYGSIVMTDSSANRITNNTFDHIENLTADLHRQPADGVRPPAGRGAIGSI